MEEIKTQNTCLSERDERMAILGELTARVVHELNSPLDGMIRYINLALNRLDNNQPEKVPEYLRRVKDGLNQWATMLAGLLDYSRDSKMEGQIIEPNKLIDDSIKMLEMSHYADGIEIIRQYSHGLSSVLAGNLGSVFSNIIKNAMQATGKGGRITVKTAQDNGQLLVKIADNGKGIPPEVMKDIFKPFFTTKPPGEGTGLGLAICKEIIERRNGTLTVRNLSTGGCEFEIRVQTHHNEDNRL